MRFNPPSRKTSGETVSLSAFRGLPVAALIAILAVILSYSFAFLMLALISDAKRIGQASSPVELSPDDVSKLKNEVLDAELVEKLKDDVKRYLEWVMAIAGVFAFAQTLAAGFTAQSFTDQAEKAIGRAEAQLDRAQTELERFKQKIRGIGRCRRETHRGPRRVKEKIHRGAARRRPACGNSRESGCAG